MMDIFSNQELGIMGETCATKYIEKIGYVVLNRNFRYRKGEIDIIAKDEKEVVFIEVKTRSNFNCGLPSEAVDYKKQKHIYNATRYYLQKFKMQNSFVRFDVIEVLFVNKKCFINHIKNVDFKV